MSCCRQECLPLVEESLSLILNDPLQLWITRCEIKAFKLFSFGHLAVNIIRVIFRPSLRQNTLKHSCKLHSLDNFSILVLFSLTHQADSLLNSVTNQTREWCLQASLLRQDLCMSVSHILPVLNRYWWGKCHCFLVVAKLELYLTVLAELARPQEVVCSLLQAVFFAGVCSVCHRHALGVLELDSFVSRCFCELCHMDHSIVCDCIEVDWLTCDKFKDVQELSLAFLQVKELIEAEHLFELVWELAVYRFLDDFVRPRTAKFERAFRCECVLRSVDHWELWVIQLCHGQKVDLEWLDEALKAECSDRSVSGARREDKWSLRMQGDAIDIWAVICECQQMIAVSDVPHFYHGVPGTRKQSEWDIWHETERSDIWLMSILHIRSPADRQWLWTLIHPPDAYSLVIATWRDYILQHWTVYHIENLPLMTFKRLNWLVSVPCKIEKPDQLIIARSHKLCGFKRAPCAAIHTITVLVLPCHWDLLRLSLELDYKGCVLSTCHQ